MSADVSDLRQKKKMFYWWCWLTEEIGTWSEICVKIESFMGMDWLWDAEGTQRRCTVKNWAWEEVLDPYSRKGLWNISLPKCANTYKVRREKWSSEGVWGKTGQRVWKKKCGNTSSEGGPALSNAMESWSIEKTVTPMGGILICSL